MARIGEIRGTTKRSETRVSMLERKTRDMRHRLTRQSVPKALGIDVKSNPTSCWPAVTDCAANRAVRERKARKNTTSATGWKTLDRVTSSSAAAVRAWDGSANRRRASKTQI